MKKIIYVFFLLAFFSFFAARTFGEPIHIWNHSINITPGPDIAFDIANDSSNNIIVVGYEFLQKIYQWKMMKLGPDGSFQWDYTENSNWYNSVAQSVAVDKDNNIIVAGYDNSTGDTDWRIMKFYPNGASIWNYTPPKLSYTADRAQAVAVDKDNNIIVAGYDNSTGNLEWRIIKLDKDKNYIWDYTYNPSPYSDQAYGVAVDKDNNITVVGFDNSTGDQEWTIIKLDKDKNLLWRITTKLSPYSDGAEGVAVDKDNNIIVVGWESVSSGDQQWRIMKLAPNGTSLWNYTDNPSPNKEYPLNAGIDNNNNIIVVGFDGNLTSPVNNQWRIIKLASDKTSLWNYSLNISPDNDKAQSIAVDKDNNYIVVGYDKNTGIPRNEEWTIMKFSDPPVCGDGKFEPWKGEECDSSFNHDAPCPPFAKCNDTCQCDDFGPNMLGCNYYDYCENGHVPNNLGTPCIFGMHDNCWTAETDEAIKTLINDTCQDGGWANHTWMTCPNGTADCGNPYCETGESSDPSSPNYCLECVP
jgi:uncharacterized delta-60 repeat protein